MFKLSFSEYLKIITILFLIFIVFCITFFKYNSNYKIEYTIDNHYKIQEIISKNLSQCKVSKIKLDKNYIINKNYICKSELDNKNVLQLVEIFVDLFKVNRICNIYKFDPKKKCLPAVLYRKNIQETLIGETSLSILNMKIQIHTKIDNNENITNIININ